MRKYWFLLCLLLCLLLSLAACSVTEGNASPPGSESTQPAIESDSFPSTAVSEQNAAPESLRDPLDTLRKNLPIMDGSTSLIPLEAGVRAALYGVTQEQAAAQVIHTSTWQSFYNLLDGAVELIFSCPLSQEQLQEAAEKNIELETVPVAKEGFVFVVNANNPVNALTQDQLRAIYSGEITNWAQVGGCDEAIIAYQRNTDSGSQNYMIAFMGDTPLMEAPVERRPATMEGLMDVIAVNDNAFGAIGYSVYAYAADMYGNGDEIKFIAVDGVAPDKQTMATGEYPLLGENYAVFRAEEPADSPVRQLVQWMTSYDGQLAIADAGYVTMEDLGYSYEEMTLRKYAGVGTGGAAVPMMASCEYVGEMDETAGYMPLEAVTENGLKTYRVRFLKDETLQQEINACIDRMMQDAADRYPAFQETMKRRNAGSEYPMYEEGPWRYSRAWKKGHPASAIVTIKNGYFSLAVTMAYTFNLMDGRECYPYTQTAVWDLLTGEQLQPEELFYDGVDIAAVLNAYIQKVYQKPLSSWGDYYKIKRDFASLPDKGWHLTADAIYIDVENPYFAEGVRINLEGLTENVMVCQQPRDFSDSLVEGPVQMQAPHMEYPKKEDHFYAVRKQFRTMDQSFLYRYTDDGLLSWAYLPEDSYPGAAQINQTVEMYLSKYYSEAVITAFFKERDIEVEDIFLWWLMDWRAENLGDRYLKYTGNCPTWWGMDGTVCMYPYSACLLFDLQTGEQLPWYGLWKDGWERCAEIRPMQEDGSIPTVEELYGMCCISIWNGTVELRDPVTGENYYISVPDDHIRWQ